MRGTLSRSEALKTVSRPKDMRCCIPLKDENMTEERKILILVGKIITFWGRFKFQILFFKPKKVPRLLSQILTSVMDALKIAAGKMDSANRILGSYIYLPFRRITSVKTFCLIDINQKNLYSWISAWTNLSARNSLLVQKGLKLVSTFISHDSILLYKKKLSKSVTYKTLISYVK